MIYAYAIVINCSNITFDGGNHTIKGAVNSAQAYVNIGLELDYVTNVSVINLKVYGFGLGDISLKGTNCNFLNVSTGYSSLKCNNSNFIGCNFGKGVDGFKQLTIVGENNTFLRNNFEGRLGCVGSNFWDDGLAGNYWSDYNGTDSNHDGIGDSSYNFVESQQDNYPLMKPYSSPISLNLLITPSIQPENSNNLQGTKLMIILASVAFVMFVGAILVIIKRR